MPNRVDGLIEKRARAWGAAKAILDAAGDAPLSAEQRSAYEAANADIDALDGDIKAEVEAEKRNKAFEELRAGRPEGGNPANPVVPGAPTDATLDEVRAFLKGEKRDMFIARETPMTMNERRSLVKGTGSAGGDTIKTSFYDQLVAALIVNSAILQTNPTVLSTTSGETIQIPKVTAHSTAALTTETSAISASDPTFDQISLSAYKYAVLVQVSRELVEDTSVDLLGYLAAEMGRAVSNKAGAQFVTGTGSSQPRGVVIDASSGVTGGTGVTGAFTSDNLIDLFYSVTSPYRSSPSCNWFMQDATMGAIRKLKDSQNRYLWQPSLVVGAPDTLLGKPIVTDPNMAAVGLSAKSVLFGDFSRYFVREVNGVRFEQSTDFAFSSDLVTFKAVWRADGALADTTGAIKYFAGGAS